MTSTPTFHVTCGPNPPRTRSLQKRQSGLVLIVSIVMLAIVSVLAALSARMAASAENVSGNVRLSALAMQAAEIALRHCENSAAELIAVSTGAPTGYPTLGFSDSNLLPASPATWEIASEWDSPTAPVYILPLAQMNQPDLAATYQRPPECMVGRVPFVLASGAISTTASFVVTARGFGPEVPAANPDRSRPNGSEVWLQSHIKLQ